MSDYEIGIILSKDIVGLTHYEYGRQAWHRMGHITKKTRDCAICKTPANEQNELPFRPLTNYNNRGHRICSSCINEMVEKSDLEWKAE